MSMKLNSTPASQINPIKRFEMMCSEKTPGKDRDKLRRMYAGEQSRIAKREKRLVKPEQKTAEPKWEKMPQTAEPLAIDFTCPSCNAQPGESCVTANGKPAKRPHASRLRLVGA
mgnify:CR=1 FL=1